MLYVTNHPLAYAGEQIAAASVAAIRGSRLLIGQIFGNGILDCVMEWCESEEFSCLQPSTELTRG